MHKILVDVGIGGGGNGQEWVTKLGFFFLLPPSLSIEIFKKNESCSLKPNMKRIAMFSHRSLNICSCMSRIMFMHC